MGLFERIITKKVEFLLVVGCSGFFDHVTLDILLKHRLSLLHVLTNHAGGSVGVGCGGMAHPQVEFEPFSNGRLESRDTLQKIHGFGPRFSVGIVNQ